VSQTTSRSRTLWSVDASHPRRRLLSCLTFGLGPRRDILILDDAPSAHLKAPKWLP
jgi:hypothetical protein